MITYSQGDIVLLPFPFSNQTSTKKRPAMIASSNEYNNSSKDVVVMAITSGPVRTTILGDCFISRWREVGLVAESVLRCGKIITVDKNLIYKTIGHMDQADMDKIFIAIKVLFEVE